MITSKFIIVGAGFFGCTLAERIANELDEGVCVLEKRPHIGGNCFSSKFEDSGIEYHHYGTHIFHTSNIKVWNYVNRFSTFNNYHHQVLTTHKNKVFQMPINLETINTFYDINLKPFEVEDFLKNEIARECELDEKTLEGWMISKVGRPLYEAFIKNYTIKQWGTNPSELPSSIIKRLPLRYNYNESYYYSKWQGIPEKGYGGLFEEMLTSEKIDLRLNVDFFDVRDQISEDSIVVYTGPIDRLFSCCFGQLDWRTLNFKHEVSDCDDYQGSSVMNFSDLDIPFTRIHEWKHLHPEREAVKGKTLITREYSISNNDENPYYPIENEKNIKIHEKYKEKLKSLPNFHVGGRLGDYKYYDMHITIENALNFYESKIKKQYYHGA